MAYLKAVALRSNQSCLIRTYIMHADDGIAFMLGTLVSVALHFYVELWGLCARTRAQI